MSLERVLKMLEEFGLSKVESEVYIYLAKVGPCKARELGSGLRMTKQQLYPALKSLKEKGIVSSEAKRVALFSALAFEELINNYVNINLEQAKTIEETKRELLATWKNMSRSNNA